MNLSSRAYAGLFRDGEAGLDFAQARSYQGRTGRFSTVDPIYAGLFAPQGWNRYAYARNAPVLYTDANGLLAEAIRVTSTPGCESLPAMCEMERRRQADENASWPSGAGFDIPNATWSPQPRGRGVNLGGTGGPGEPTGPEPPGPMPPGPTPPAPPPPAANGEDLLKCTVRVSSRMSIASVAGVDESWLGDTLLGNDFASLTQLGRDLASWSGWGSAVVSNPTPFNLTARTLDGVMKARVGPRDVAKLRETSSGGIEVHGWNRRWEIGKTWGGRAVGAGLRVFSTAKIWYDGVTYAGAMAYCGAK